MSPLSLMEWNPKSPTQWDLENLIMFNTQTEIPKKPRPQEWDPPEGEKVIDSTSLYSSGSGNSSSAGEIKIPKPGTAEISEFTPRTTGEPLLGLKLGKRTYFEDVCGGNSAKTTSFNVTPGSSGSSVKKCKGSNSQGSIVIRCQVEGCGLDLSGAKDYHRKHRVCENHSKSPKVIVGGLERRFCQQCSRFHGLSEFDEKKRSCRRRLSDHNARRRKPQPEAVQLNPARLASSLFDERQPMSLLWNRASLVHHGRATMEGESSTKFTITKDYVVKPGKVALDIDKHQLPLNHHDSKTLSPFKPKLNSIEALNQGMEEPIMSPSVDATQDLHRALSLLSTASWASSDPKPPGPMVQAQPDLQTIPQGVPISSADYWRTEQNPQNDTGSYFQEFQLLRSPYDSADFYSGHLN